MSEGGSEYGDDTGGEIPEGDPNDVPDEISNEQPDEDPGELSNDDPFDEYPDEDPNTQPNNDPFDEYPDEDPTVKPNDDPFDEYPDEDPTAKPNDDPFDEFPDEDPNTQPNDDPFDEYPDEDPNTQPNDDPFDEYPDEDPNTQPNDDPFDEYLDENPDEHTNEGPHDEYPDEIGDEVHEELRGEEKNSEEDVEEINSSVETENIGTDQSTLILQQESQEPFSRDKEGNIILDAETMEFFGEHVSSQDEMEVEILEEEMEKLFNSYEERGLEQEQVLTTSHDSEQEKVQEQEEDKTNHKIEQTQEQKLSQEPSYKSQKEISQTPRKNNIKKIESIREQDEEEKAKESSQKRIQENKREITQEKEQPQEQNQEIEQKSIQEAHQILKESEIKEQYKQETGRRPVYAGKETKGFINWKKYLKQQKEDQEEKKISLHKNEKETKEQSKEIREFNEEWAQYLANSIKKSEFPKDGKEKLIKFLEKYVTLRELLEKLKTKEISEEEFEEEVNKFEHILIEKSYIARPLFMNFDWFRRYYNEIIRTSGKRVANLYISKKTREFLSYISRRTEQLKNLDKSPENTEKFEEFLEKSFQIREKWALLLNNLIHKVSNKEISKEVKEELETVIKTYCEIRTILFNKKILKDDKEKLIQGRIEKYDPRFFELFEILKRFLGIYENYSRNWMEQSLILEGNKIVKCLSQKLEIIKKEKAIHQILNGEISSIQNLKEILRENLYKTTELTMNEKSKIIEIIQKKQDNEEDKSRLKLLLKKLSIGELDSLIGESFNQVLQTNVKNGLYDIIEPKKILNQKLISQDEIVSNLAEYKDSEEKNRFLNNGEKIYVLPTKWIKVKTSVLSKIREILKDRNIRVKEINKIIGQDFSKISKGRRMKEENFFKLNNLVGEDTLKKIFNQDFIPHDVYIGQDKYIPIERTEISAEFISIMLGDGHLDKNGSSTTIALNIIDDPDYVKYVKHEIIDKLFKKNSNFVEYFNHKLSPKSVVLISQRKSVHYAIYELGKSIQKKGLIPGNKVKNEVDVPDWVYFDKSEGKVFLISSLRGLFDTDGSISVIKNRNTLNLAFSNSSLPLCKDFIQMCSILGIKTGNIIKSNKENGNPEYQVYISSKSQIKEFFNKIKPQKITERKRRIFLGCQLIYLSLGKDIVELMEHQINIWKNKNNEMIFKYTKKNADLLKVWCETEFLRNDIKNLFGYPFLEKITDNMIDRAISEALVYRYTTYESEKAKFYVYLYKKLGNLSRIREYLRDIGNNVIPDKETIKKYIIQYLGEQKVIGSNNFFERNKITSITLYKGTNQINSFPRKLRNIICGVLYDKLFNFSVKVKNSFIINQLKVYFRNNDILLMNWLLDKKKDHNFYQALTSYFKDLIFLIKEILNQLSINQHASIQSLSKIKDIPFKYSVIREILNYLISVKI